MKLDGIRVVDLSVFLPGPYLTLAMADHGAEVIKVEQPGEGDPGRHIGLSDGPSTVFFRNLNRGKKSVTLDLKSAGGRETLLRLCETADVFVEAFRPGVMARLGIDYAAVSARNPRIVYCSISAFGQTGPYRDLPAHDLAVEAIAGVIGLARGSDGRPVVPAVPVADLVAGLQSLSGVLMALLRSRQTGRGDYLDMSMHDCIAAATLNVLGPVFAENRDPAPGLERTSGGAAFYRVYRTADGADLVLAGQEAKFIHNLLTALGRPELIELCTRGPGAHQAPVIAFLEATFATRTRAAWLDFLGTLDVCFGPVKTLTEAFEDPHLLAREMVLVDAAGRRHVGPPIRFRDEPARPSLAEPALGQDNHLLERKGQVTPWSA